jgi:hypothetical protein
MFTQDPLAGEMLERDIQTPKVELDQLDWHNSAKPLYAICLPRAPSPEFSWAWALSSKVDFCEATPCRH